MYLPDCYMQQLATSSFICFFFKSAFAWADLIFYNFLESHSAFSAKNIEYMKKNICHISHPLNHQNPLSVTKVFCWCSLNHKDWIVSWPPENQAIGYYVFQVSLDCSVSPLKLFNFVGNPKDLLLKKHLRSIIYIADILQGLLLKRV